MNNEQILIVLLAFSLIINMGAVYDKVDTYNEYMGTFSMYENYISELETANYELYNYCLSGEPFIEDNEIITISLNNS